MIWLTLIGWNSEIFIETLIKNLLKIWENLINFNKLTFRFQFISIGISISLNWAQSYQNELTQFEQIFWELCWTIFFPKWPLLLSDNFTISMQTLSYSDHKTHIYDLSLNIFNFNENSFQNSFKRINENLNWFYMSWKLKKLLAAII